ncbi:hypothetical protein PQX77_015233 [Marasmius sp. AFHP31]|nr:hypothetical protein PQX77_015233 [Marasmius sp. AFHP31]
MTTLAWRSQDNLRRFLPPTAILVDHLGQQQEASTSEKRKRASLDDTFGAGPSSLGPSGSYHAMDTAQRDMSDGSTEAAEEEPMKKKKKAVTAKSPTIYNSSVELLNALSNALRASQDVVFAGSYLDSNNPPMSDKQRVQVVTNDVWRATGYRFTVKDHPRTKDGHKTRLWCSQDEMRKHKPNAKARVSASGESLAKARYPCRSRLFISSRAWNTIGQSLVTIRLHHHYSHEPYDGAVKASAPVTTWTGPPSNTQQVASGAQAYSSLISPHQAAYENYEGASNRSPLTTVDQGGNVDWDNISDDGLGPPAGDSESEVDELQEISYAPPPIPTAPVLPAPITHLHSDPGPHVHLHTNGIATTLTPHSHPPPSHPHPQSHSHPALPHSHSLPTHTHTHSQSQPQPQPQPQPHTQSLPQPQPQSRPQSQAHPHTQPQPQPRLQPSHPHPLLHPPPSTSDPPVPTLSTHVFQERMRQHIRNIREFCDGLEYQVQFNDFRMLEELEKEGGSFLRFVHTCLHREGRLEAQLQHPHQSAGSGMMSG